MANLKVDWTLPTTRRSGKPIAPGDISLVHIAISADGGVSFVDFDSYPPSILTTTITDLEPGQWYVRGVVQDSAGRLSLPVVTSITIPDETPPGQLVTLTLSLA